MSAFQQDHSHIVRLVITVWSIILWVWLVVKTTAGKSMYVHIAITFTILLCKNNIFYAEICVFPATG